MTVTVAATQMSCVWDVEPNLAKAERLIRKAASAGANIVLLQEMFATHFFAFNDWKSDYFAFAHPLEGNPILARMRKLAAELGVVLPVNVFVPGCPPRPEAIIDGVIQLLNSLKA